MSRAERQSRKGLLACGQLLLLVRFAGRLLAGAKYPTGYDTEAGMTRKRADDPRLWHSDHGKVVGDRDATGHDTETVVTRGAPLRVDVPRLSRCGPLVVVGVNRGRQIDRDASLGHARAGVGRIRGAGGGKADRH